ncbi:hypothetical protein [Rhodothermus marinus]|uniref:Uncharacterized protein n=1 Tax=Rhodothermus marinus (strain ATCC 43812 / DSM 4252 / R-10) TaxID=518766 RepID=D0MHF3_RHOM4|nr:hypothetical protein [Rhodothermus marinus]ACY47911.1 hypothetical protein Rmar_1017 [Rhodothermus marinus DSM 4252]
MNEQIRKRHLQRALAAAQAVGTGDENLFAAALRAAAQYLHEGEVIVAGIAAVGEADGRLVLLQVCPLEGGALRRLMERAARAAQALGSPSCTINLMRADGSAGAVLLEPIASGEN